MDDPAGEDAGASARTARFPAALLPGVLSSLVTVALLVPVPPRAALIAVAVLVAGLAVLAAVGARRAWSATLAGQVLWFWGAVTGLGHLLRALVDDPSGVESAVIGAAVTVVWASCLVLLRRARRRS